MVSMNCMPRIREYFGFELEEVMDWYDPIHARPMSQAMVNLATGETRVFNYGAATATSF
jgi:hypothetical protein